jgi:hypothetical protein
VISQASPELLDLCREQVREFNGTVVEKHHSVSVDLGGEQTAGDLGG